MKSNRRKLHAEQAAVLAEAKRKAFLDTVLAHLPTTTDKSVFMDSVNAFKELVDLIEADKHPVCKDHYDKYLRLTKTPMAVLAVLCAGGNRNGVLSAARINGVKLS